MYECSVRSICSRVRMRKMGRRRLTLLQVMASGSPLLTPVHEGCAAHRAAVPATTAAHPAPRWCVRRVARRHRERALPVCDQRSPFLDLYCRRRVSLVASGLARRRSGSDPRSRSPGRLVRQSARCAGRSGERRRRVRDDQCHRTGHTASRPDGQPARRWCSAHRRSSDHGRIPEECRARGPAASRLECGRSSPCRSGTGVDRIRHTDVG
jgi:hypothetical protein